MAIAPDGMPYIAYKAVFNNNGTVMKLSPQQNLTSVTVTANIAGLSVTVDGTSYITPHTFSWAVGSSHSISTGSPQIVIGESGTQYLFKQWSDNLAQTHSITTPSADATYTANFNTQFLLSWAVSSLTQGKVCVFSILCQPSGQIWLDEGRYSVFANPYDGYKFTKWTGPVDYANKSHTTYALNGPISLTANFTDAPKLIAKITGKSGGNADRLWQVSLINVGKGGTAYNAQITSWYVNFQSGAYSNPTYKNAPLSTSGMCRRVRSKMGLYTLALPVATVVINTMLQRF